EALGKSGPRGLAYLRRSLSDKDSQVRRSTYDALAALLPDEAVAVWAAALRDADPSLRAYAVERLIKEADSSDEIEAIRAALIQAGGDRDASVRTAAIQFLALRGVIEADLAAAYREALAEAI